MSVSCYKHKNKYISCTAWLILLTLFFMLTAPVCYAAADTAKAHLIYHGPTEQSVAAGTVYDGETVTILNPFNEQWTKIQSENGTIGYCRSSLLGITHEAEKEISSEAHLRAKTARTVSLLKNPNDTPVSFGTLAANVSVTILSTDTDSFYRIQTHCGRIGYVPVDSVTVLTEPTATVRTVPVLSETGAATEEEAAEKLSNLSLYFEDGSYWNHIGTGKTWSDETLFCITDMPCTHSYRSYTYCNVYNGALSAFFPQYGTEMQCLGYASLISDLVFGTDAPISMHHDFSKVRVGDHLRLYLWEHSMVVTEVGTDENGEQYVYVTEVNADYENCQIQWGRKFTQQDLRRLGDILYIYTRYSDENQED